VRIDHLIWDRGNIAAMARLGVRPHEVDDTVYLERWVYRSNLRYPGQIKVIGYSPAERWLTVPMEPALAPNGWRPIAAWPSTEAEVDEYARIWRQRQ
jgi:hypothetical protein